MALNPIEILKEVIASVAHTITITSIDSLGSGSYKLNTPNTLYLRTLKKVTIDSIEYTITDFDINSYITVEATDGTDQAVTATSFNIDVPLFKWGNPQMVSAEIVKAIGNGDNIWPYMWVVEVGNTQKTLNPALAVRMTPSFNIFFLDSADKNNWSIEDHYDQDIYPLNNYIEFFTNILKSRRDLFDTDSIDFNQINHVNFGDYIVDQGNKTKILNDNVTGIQVQIDIPYIIDACDSTDIIQDCNPATYRSSLDSFIQQIGSGETFVSDDINVTINGDDQGDFETNVDIALTFGGSPAGNEVNGATKTDIVGGTTKNFVIKYANGDAVDITQDSDNAILFEGNIPNILSTDVFYNRPYLTQSAPYNDYDENWRLVNGGNAYNDAIPSQALIQQIKPDIANNRYDYLKYFNKWGHKFQFVGELGGYVDEADGLTYDKDGVLSVFATEFPVVDLGGWWVYDCLTGYRLPSTRLSNRTWIQSMDETQTFTGFDGVQPWFAFTGDEAQQLNNNSNVTESLRSPSNRPFFVSGSILAWTGTTRADVTAHAILYNGDTYGGAVSSSTKTGTRRQFYFVVAYTGSVPQP